MNKKKQRGTYEDDLEDQYFDDDEDAGDKNQGENEDEVDPLDAYMQNLSANIPADQPRTSDSGKKQEILTSDDPLDSFMDSMKSKLIKDYNKKHNIKKKEGDGDNEEDLEQDEANYEFLDSEGELDFDAVKKMKKQKIEPLPAVEHSKIQYEPFNKDFYDEHAELKALPDNRVRQLRQEMDIRVHGSDVPKPLISFGHLPFDERMINLIQKKQFEKPTPIQCQALPCVLSGRDVIGIAKTGSGKTLAYVWPMIIHVLDQREVAKNEGPIGLILCPTRELAQQVYVETKKFAKAYNCKVAALLGGENKHEQWKELKAGVDIIIATPGRLMEMIKKKATNLQRCSYVVLDEADRMFSMGFEYQVRSIIGQIRPDRQTLLFSATFRDKIQKLCIDILHDPIRINVGKDNQANEDVKQEVVVLYKPEDKLAWLVGNIPYFYQLGKILIFANQIASCEELAKQISEGLSLNTLVLHGDKLQQERTQIINQYKTSAEYNILVATDVASRGLDIPDIRSVVNYECPKDGDTYIHRIGRTGRAGNKEGTAYTLIMRHEVKFAITLAKILDISGQPVPKDLENIALQDEEYVRNQKMKKMGLKKGNAASKLLEKALAGGRRGTAGLGYNQDKPANKNQESEEQGRRLTFQKSSYSEPSNAQNTSTNYAGSMPFVQSTASNTGMQFVGNMPFVQPQTQMQQGMQYVQYGAPAANVNYYQAPQTAQNLYQQQQPNNMYQQNQRFVAASNPRTNTVASAREQVMSEYTNRLKGTMQNQFKSSFVSSGSLEASSGLPTIVFKNKPKGHSEDEPKPSNITIQLPKKQSRFSDQSQTSNSNTSYCASRFTYERDDDEGRVPTKKVKSNWDRPPEDS